MYPNCVNLGVLAEQLVAHFAVCSDGMEMEVMFAGVLCYFRPKWILGITANH